MLGKGDSIIQSRNNIFEKNRYNKKEKTKIPK